MWTVPIVILFQPPKKKKKVESSPKKAESPSKKAKEKKVKDKAKGKDKSKEKSKSKKTGEKAKSPKKMAPVQVKITALKKASPKKTPKKGTRWKVTVQGWSPYHLLWLSLCDGPLMLLLNWTIAGTVHLKLNNFVTGLKIKATAYWKLHNSPAINPLLPKSDL